LALVELAAKYESVNVRPSLALAYMNRCPEPATLDQLMPP
jgi:hypothetical protein